MAHHTLLPPECPHIVAVNKLGLTTNARPSVFAAGHDDLIVEDTGGNSAPGVQGARCAFQVTPSEE